jgi:hypothetical protein
MDAKPKILRMRVVGLWRVIVIMERLVVFVMVWLFVERLLR